MTGAEESPDYAKKVVEYLAKAGARRIPWGHILASGHLVQKVTSKEIRDRHELGEIAIELIGRLYGVSVQDLETIANEETTCPTIPSPECAPSSAESPT